MKIRIIQDRDKIDISKGKKIQDYEIDGHTVMPWYINCLSIRYKDERLEFTVLDEVIVKKSYNNDDGEHLWIIGKDKMTVTEQIKRGLKPEYEKIM